MSEKSSDPNDYKYIKIYHQDEITFYALSNNTKTNYRDSRRGKYRLFFNGDFVYRKYEGHQCATCNQQIPIVLKHLEQHPEKKIEYNVQGESLVQITSQ